MRKSALFLPLLAAVWCLFCTQELKAQQIDGYTSMDYDEVSNIDTAYSETTVDYDVMGDYDAYVSLNVYDQYGTYIIGRSARDSYGDGFVSVTIQFSGTPDTTYTAKGTHKAYASLYDYDDFYPYRIYYWDYYWFGFFEGQGIYVPWYRSFFYNGFREVTRRSRYIPLGTTYDYASVTTPGSLQVTMSSAQNIKDGGTANFNVTTSGDTPSNYEWSFRAPSRAGNSPNVAFNPNGSAHTTTDGHWFASPNDPCSASFDARYTIKCMVTFSNGKKKSAETNLTVNAFWNPAGSVAPPEITGGVQVAFDSSRNLWYVAGSGTATRVTHSAVINVPTSSQFYNKTLQHEQKHEQQWASGMLSDLFQISDLMTQLSPLTDSTQAGLNAQIASTFTKIAARKPPPSGAGRKGGSLPSCID